jgi:hypothetical protein
MVSRAELDQVGSLTTLLRASPDPFWSRLRLLLLERGVVPERVALAECFPDDNSFEFGIVVGPDASVFQFGFDYLGKDVADGVLSEWEDLTGRFQATPYRVSVEAALKFLENASAS